MAALNPDSRAGQVRKAEAVLKSLLRTPKTREGLIAAVINERISKNFVFGWLSEQVKSGAVVQFHDGVRRTYQIVGEVVAATSAQSPYPAWLDPRALPTAVGRRLLLDGKEVHLFD